jgi:hypothetical protein
MEGSFDRKLVQLRLQDKIFNLLYSDNGVSSHFDYHLNLMSDEETIKLNLLTYNKRHDEYMLFHTVMGSSSIDCLQKMLTYIQDHQKKDPKNSYTISWKKAGDEHVHKSYFIAASTEEAIDKFLHEKNPDQFEFRCELNPVS